MPNLKNILHLAVIREHMDRNAPVLSGPCTLCFEAHSRFCNSCIYDQDSSTIKNNDSRYCEDQNDFMEVY
jgi:hypothetical protein